MRDPVFISRDQLIRCLRDAGWSHKAEKRRVELYKKPGSPERLSISKRKSHPESYVRMVLGQAGLRREQIEEFLKKSVKDGN